MEESGFTYKEEEEMRSITLAIISECFAEKESTFTASISKATGCDYEQAKKYMAVSTGLLMYKKAKRAILE